MVSVLTIQRWRIRQTYRFAIYPRSQITLLPKVFKQITEFTLLSSDHGCHEPQRCVCRQRKNSRRDCIAGLCRDQRPAFWAMSRANASEQHSQKVIDFGDRTDGTTRIVPRRFLADRNGRTETANQIHIRLRHLPHKLPSIVAKAFDVTSLSFRIERVECQRRFTATRNTRKTDQLASRQRHVHVAQVMLSGTFDLDFRCRHALCQTCPLSVENPQIAPAYLTTLEPRKRNRKGWSNRATAETPLRSTKQQQMHQFAALAGFTGQKPP